MSSPIEQIIRQLHNTDILEYKLDSITSSICMASLTMNCNICNKHIIKNYLMCSKCNGASHLTCTKHKKNQQYSQTNMRHHMFHMYHTKHKTQYRHPLTSSSTQICHLCKRPWTPMKIPVKNKFNNLHDLLELKGYIRGQQQTNPFISSTVDHKRYGKLQTNFSITLPT